MSEYNKDIKAMLKKMDGSNENTMTKLDKLVNEAIKNATEADLLSSVEAIEGFLCETLKTEGNFKKSA